VPGVVSQLPPIMTTWQVLQMLWQKSMCLRYCLEMIP
jgi:hypothetical protein